MNIFDIIKNTLNRLLINFVKIEIISRNYRKYENNI